MVRTIKLFFALFFEWKIRTPPSELLKAQVIITHEFGDQHTLSAITAQMVDVGCELSKRFGIPLICQYPGDRQAVRNQIKPMLVINENLFDENGYLDTQEVNRQLFEVCWTNNWTHVIVCAHPDHVWRAAKNIKNFGLIPLVPDLSHVHYDPNCTRFSLAHRWVFVPRELLARLLYFAKGYLTY